MKIDECVHGARYHHAEKDAVVLQPARHVDDELRECRQVRAETLEQAFELRNHENQQDDRHDDGNSHHGRGVEQGLLDLLLQRLGLFLVGGDLVEQRLQRAGLFAGLDEVYEQVVEMQRMFAERFVQRGAAFDVSLDVENEFLHRRLVVAVADDFKRLHQRNAGREHRRELSAEYRDVFGLDLAAALERRALLLDPADGDALAAQVGAQRGFIGRKALAGNPVAFLVHASPGKRACHALRLWRRMSLLQLP